MVDPFEAVSFLTRSENRVDVLVALSGRRYRASELVEELDISEATAGRILEDFTERGWVREADGRYGTTPMGDILAADYERLHESMDLAANVGPALDALPVEEMDFDLRELRGSSVVGPDRANQLRTLDGWRELVRDADHVVGVAPTENAVLVVAEPFRDAVVENDLRLEIVVSHGYVERAMERPDLRELLCEILEAGAELYRAPADADITTALATFDDRAAISGYDDAGAHRVAIVTRADAVHRWIRDTYDAHRSDAVRLTPADLDP